MGRRTVLRAAEVVTIDGAQYTLTFDMNAAADLESITGENAFDMIDKIMEGQINASGLRALMWAQLQEHHPGTDLRAAGRLASADFEACVSAVRAAIIKAVPPAEPDQGNAPAPTTPASTA